jgi:hypothetical protein
VGYRTQVVEHEREIDSDSMIDNYEVLDKNERECRILAIQGRDIDGQKAILDRDGWSIRIRMWVYLFLIFKHYD